MENEVNVQRSKLFPDGMLHIEFLDGNSYLYSLEEIADIIAAQHSVQLTALRRGLAVSIFINVILLAVVAFTIGGG
jgi:hypothetical protein